MLYASSKACFYEPRGFKLYELINACTDQMKPNVSKTLIKASDKFKNEIANVYIFNSHLMCMKLNRS